MAKNIQAKRAPNKPETNAAARTHRESAVLAIMSSNGEIWASSRVPINAIYGELHSLRNQIWQFSRERRKKSPCDSPRRKDRITAAIVRDLDAGRPMCPCEKPCECPHCHGEARLFALGRIIDALRLAEQIGDQELLLECHQRSMDYLQSNAQQRYKNSVRHRKKRDEARAMEKLMTKALKNGITDPKLLADIFLNFIATEAFQVTLAAPELAPVVRDLSSDEDIGPTDHEALAFVTRRDKVAAAMRRSFANRRPVDSLAAQDLCRAGLCALKCPRAFVKDYFSGADTV